MMRYGVFEKAGRKIMYLDQAHMKFTNMKS